MRLAPLLAQYLYQYKHLELPGLGSFTLEHSEPDDPDSQRHGKAINTENIRFETNTSIKESPELISFIAAQTGKIKALASADLESHLELAHQFLNIGKPFYIEGIGTIVKIRAGEFTFAPGTAIAELKKENTPKEQVVTAEATPGDYNYKNIFYPKPVKSKWKKPAVVILLVAGLAVAIWGGYTVYKKTSAKKEKEEPVKEETANTEKKDTTVAVKDTVAVNPPSKTVIPPGNYKFILESSGPERAFSRFNQLKNFQWNVQMETNDSVTYKIYMLLPATASDTSRLRDSLRKLTGKKVYIE